MIWTGLGQGFKTKKARRHWLTWAFGHRNPFAALVTFVRGKITFVIAFDLVKEDSNVGGGQSHLLSFASPTLPLGDFAW